MVFGSLHKYELQQAMVLAMGKKYLELKKLVVNINCAYMTSYTNEVMSSSSLILL
jgi:hypothetical protein